MSDEGVNRRVLIVGDQADEVRTVRDVLQHDLNELSSADDIETGLRLFQEKLPALLVLSFRELEKAERFYLMLHRQCPTIKDIRHQTLLLCKSTEAELAFSLCKSGTLDDYFVNRPLHDPFRLRLAVVHALARKDMRSQSAIATQQLSQIGSDIRQLDTFIGRAMATGHGHQAESIAAFREFASHLMQELEKLSVHPRVLSPDDSTVSGEPGGLRMKIEQLRNEIVEPRVRQLDGSFTEAKDWLRHFEDGYREKAVSLPVPDAPQKQREVMLVDDDDVYREMLGAILEEVEISVSSAASGEAALAEMSRHHPDIVLLDYAMPGLNGMEVLKAMKRDPALKEIPVVMLSGSKDRQTVNDAIIAGASGFIVKPSNRPTILAKIQGLLG